MYLRSMRKDNILIIFLGNRLLEQSEIFLSQNYITCLLKIIFKQQKIRSDIQPNVSGK